MRGGANVWGGHIAEGRGTCLDDTENDVILSSKVCTSFLCYVIEVVTICIRTVNTLRDDPVETSLRQLWFRIFFYKVSELLVQFYQTDLGLRNT